MKLAGRRRGAAVVEVAVTLPIIVVFLQGAVEFGRAQRLQSLVEEAAQAACRVYSVPDTTAQDAIDVAESAMAAGGVAKYQIALDPPLKSGIDEPMEPVTVTISLLVDSHAAGNWFFAGKTLTGEAVLPAEY